MELIDTHVHLIYRDRFGYSWTQGIPALAQGDFTIKDYSALSQDRVSGMIFMETGVDDQDYQAEARFVATMGDRPGLLGQIASCRPETDEGFDAWLEECTQLNVVGFRRILHVMPDELSQSVTFRRNVKKIGARAMVFDVCVLARQLGIALELAKSCDDQPLVLNHCGVPDIASGAFDAWAEGVSELAALDHVHVKLSGLSAYCAPDNRSVATLAPWVDHVVTSFGPSRIVWGGDWPVVNLGSGLPDWISATETLLNHLSASERTAIASGNAKKLYGV